MIGKIFWVALTAVFTLAFIVLFENGTTNYAENFKAEIVQAKEFFTSGPVKKKPDASDKLP